MGCQGCSIVVDFKFDWWDVPDLGVEPAVVVPVDPACGGVFHVRDRRERAVMERIVLGHCLGLNKPIVDSASALSYASPTLLTEARIPSSMSSSLNRNAKY